MHVHVQVYQLLQGFVSSSNWEEKAEVVTCPGGSAHSQSYRKLKDGRWKVDLFGMKDVAIETKKCISVIGFTETILSQLLEDMYVNAWFAPTFSKMTSYKRNGKGILHLETTGC